MPSMPRPVHGGESHIQAARRHKSVGCLELYVLNGITCGICRLLAEKKRKKAAEKTAKKAARGKTSLTAANGTGPASAAMREKLRHMRVVQPNLVYVVGLPLDIAKETVGALDAVSFAACQT